MTFRIVLATTFTALLIFNTLLAGTPASAGRMLWTPVDTPSNEFYTIASPSELDFVAMGPDSVTIYCADTAGNKLYRSEDSGLSWLEIGGNLSAAGAALPVWNIALAPDNPKFIAAVTSAGGLPREIFVSSDGGQNWYSTNFAPAANIGALAVSPGYGVTDIAAGTRSGGNGKIFILKGTGTQGTWIDQGFTGDVLSLRFPSGYRADTSLAVLYADASGTYFNVGIHDVNANTTNWSMVYGGNPPELSSSGPGTSPKANQVITGDLELPADYSGQSPALCRAYASIDAAGGNAGIFRIDGTVAFQLMNAANRRISSIAYFGTYGNGKLLAGEVSGDPLNATVITWFTDAPMTCPATCWYRTEKQPTGAGTSGYANAQVIWAPDGGRAFCFTGSALLPNAGAWPAGYLNSVALDESAVSISRDNGQTWNQLSIIDTRISFLSDVVLTSDTGTIYLASINTGGAGLDSIWRSGSTATGKSWERILCFISPTNDVILRADTYKDDPAVFMASRGTADLRQSQDKGDTWKSQLPGITVNDFSVTSVNGIRSLYVLSGPWVRQANVSSLTPAWSRQAASTLNASHTIFAAPNGCVVVGGDTVDSHAAFSADAGNSFSLTTALPQSGRMHTVTDYRFSQGTIIYAASDNPGSNIYYWIPGTSRSWETLGAPTSGYWGLAQASTLYGASTEGLAPAVDRTLDPESLGPPVIEWDTLTAGLLPGMAFTREPLSLKLSPGVNLWAIDNRPYDYLANTGRLWNMCDCLSQSPSYRGPAPVPRETLFAAPIPVSPAEGGIVPIYVADNSVGEIILMWKHNTNAQGYEVWVSKDPTFNVITAKKVVMPRGQAPSWDIEDRTVFKAGTTYYWKTRVVQAATGEKGTGAWSQVASFATASNNPVTDGNTPPQPTPGGDISPQGPTTPPSASTSANTTTGNPLRPAGELAGWIYLTAGALLMGAIVLVILALAKRRKF